MGFLQGLLGVIGPVLPKRKTLVMLVIGTLIGLVWGYAISPTIYYDADPSTLRQEFQDEWVKLQAERNANAQGDIGNFIAQQLLYVDDPLGIVDRLLSNPAEAENHQKLQAIRPYAEQAQANAAKAPQPSIVADILPFILAPLVLVIVSTIIAVLWGLLIYPFLEPTLSRMSRRAGKAGAVSDQKAAAEIAAIKEAKKAQETLKQDFSATTLGKPLIQKMSIYTPGRQYDDSFSIEDEQERFLGECGAGISETIGDNVTAVEVWLFDKDDFVKTATVVLASKHAASDPTLRSKLEAKGNVVVVEPGAVASVETTSLMLQARVVDVQYGAGGLPNSYFDKMTLELAAWRKQGAGAPTPVAPPPAAFQPMSAPASAPTFTPPPSAQVTPLQPPPGGQFAPPLRPPAPPPAAPPARPPDDDPFGGTGDFTPIS